MDFKGTENYIASRDLQVAVQAAINLQKPLLIKGEPGTGKTLLAYEIAKALNKKLITWHIKSTTTAQQGLYEYDAVSRLRDSQLGNEKVNDIANYIKKGKLWEAFESEEQLVLLIDEIDKADIEFPNDLLLEIDKMEFFCYETGETIVAKNRPIIIITSNNEKELPDAFLRRCFFHYISFPDRETLKDIIDLHYEKLDEKLVSNALDIFYAIRDKRNLKKKPSTSEIIDWIKLLIIGKITTQELDAVKNGSNELPYLGALLKNEQDKKPFYLHINNLYTMFIDFFLLLKNNKIPVSIKEYFDLLEALNQEIASYNIDDFYFLCRSVLVKNEIHLDTFDQLFGLYFEGIETISTEDVLNIPEEWLRKNGEKFLSKEEMEKIKSFGDLDKILDRLKELLKEQKERHQGGGKWIGTGGVSPFGAYGYNPEGIRIGQDESRHRRAIKVWDKRSFQNLNEEVELETRNMKMALKKLRILSREGKAEELDLNKTIIKTSKNAGMLEVEMVPSKKNTVKVLLFFDIGGSMDDHIELCSQLFSAAKYEFKHLSFYYFHNCIYEFLWKDNARRWHEKIPTDEILNTYNEDYKVIIVGDASMSPYEIFYKNGSVEHYNEEAGITWLNRIKEHFPYFVWLNPVAENDWQYTESIGMIKKVMNNRMYPLTISGIEQAIKCLKQKNVVTENSLME